MYVCMPVGFENMMGEGFICTPLASGWEWKNATAIWLTSPSQGAQERHNHPHSSALESAPTAFPTHPSKRVEECHAQAHPPVLADYMECATMASARTSASGDHLFFIF